MSNKPKQQDYKPSEAEKTQAAVSKAEKDYFDQKYGPLLREMRDLADKEDFSATAKGRAQADTMQALTSRPSIQAARSVDTAANLASAAGSQQAQADFQALQAKRQRQVGVLGTARGQAADATTGLSRAAQIQSTKDLEFAKAKQQERDARFAAGLKLAGTAVGQGMQNMQGGDGGSFFKPAGLDTAMAADGGVGGLMGRLRVGSYGSYDPVSGEYRGG
tara:strand:+ start:890 stop:1546 length:657 start_codon:yes stop_codon:yes gene_type:complete